MKYQFTITGLTPLIIDQDNIAGQKRVKAWVGDPKNTNLSVAGDERTPPWTWKIKLYAAEGTIGIPSDMIMVALRDAGATSKVPGQGSKTYKSVAAAGLLIDEIHLPILVGGKSIPSQPVEEIEGPFADQFEEVKKHGFSLFVKRARPKPGTKHVRVRPRFDEWKLTGTIETLVEEITTEVLERLFNIAGTYKGLGNWRPSCSKPGQFGRFKTELKAV